MKNTAVVILNWNGENYLKKFLPSVIKYSPETRVIVADNNSSDNSLAILKQDFSEVEIIELDKNYGFAGGYNECLKKVSAEIFVLLNSDVEVTEGWLTPLINNLKSDINLAAVQPKLLSYSNKAEFEYAGAAGGLIDKNYFAFCRGRIFNKLETDKGQYETNEEIFWATGACLAIKADCFKEVNGFDSDFFAHMEEIDLCFRLKNRGYKIAYNPNSKVYHVGGGTLNSESPFKSYLNYRNNLFLIVKNHFTSPLFFKLLVRLTLDGVSCGLHVINGDFKKINSVLKAHMSFYRSLPKFLQKRKLERKSLRNPNLSGLYKRSILIEFFLLKHFTFNSLSSISSQ